MARSHPQSLRQETSVRLTGSLQIIILCDNLNENQMARACLKLIVTGSKILFLMRKINTNHS